jgi:hypothetical protein
MFVEKNACCKVSLISYVINTFVTVKLRTGDKDHQNSLSVQQVIVMSMNSKGVIIWGSPLDIVAQTGKTIRIICVLIWVGVRHTRFVAGTQSLARIKLNIRHYIPILSVLRIPLFELLLSIDLPPLPSTNTPSNTNIIFASMSGTAVDIGSVDLSQVVIL